MHCISTEHSLFRSLETFYEEFLKSSGSAPADFLGYHQEHVFVESAPAKRAFGRDEQTVRRWERATQAKLLRECVHRHNQEKVGNFFRGLRKRDMIERATLIESSFGSLTERNDGSMVANRPRQCFVMLNDRCFRILGLPGIGRITQRKNDNADSRRYLCRRVSDSPLRGEEASNRSYPNFPLSLELVTTHSRRIEFESRVSFNTFLVDFFLLLIVSDSGHACMLRYQ